MTQNVDAVNELELQRWHVARLQVDLASLRNENRRLRRLTDNGAAGRILARTADDARAMCGWRFSNYTISRRACVGYGLSERRWMWSISLLRLAGVVDLRTRYVDDFLIDELPLCLDAIDKAVRKCEKAGLGPLVFRMARGRVQTPKG